MKKKKQTHPNKESSVVIFIVEGKSDENALRSWLEEISATLQIEFINYIKNELFYLNCKSCSN